MRNIYPFILVVSVLFSGQLYAVTLGQVLSYALREAPQFKEDLYATKGQIEELKKIVAIYDTVLSGSVSQTKSRSRTSGKLDRTDLNQLSLGKKIGAGITLGAGYTTEHSQYSSGINSYKTNLQLSADIDLLRNFFGRVDSSSITIGQKDSEILQRYLKEGRESMIYGIAQAYMTAVYLEKVLGQERKLLKSVIDLSKATKRKKKLGSAEQRNVLQMDAKVANYKMGILEKEQALENSLSNLEVLAGRRRFSNLAWPTMIFDDVKIFVNLELQRLQLEKEKLGLQLVQARSNFLPELKFQSTYGYGNLNYLGYEHFSLGQGSDQGAEQTLALSLTFPLGNSLDKAEKSKIKMQLMAKDYQIKRERSEYRKERNTVKKSLHNYKKQLQLAQQIGSLQESRYRRELKAYRQGRSGINDINTAQNDLLNAQIMVINKVDKYYSYCLQQLYLSNGLEKQLLK